MAVGGRLMEEGEEVVRVAIELSWRGGGRGGRIVIRATGEASDLCRLPAVGINVHGDGCVEDIGSDGFLHPGSLPGVRKEFNLCC